MRKNRYNKLEVRNPDLVTRFWEIYRNYGSLASSISKQRLYEEVAEEFYLNWETAARIIRASKDGCK